LRRALIATAAVFGSVGCTEAPSSAPKWAASNAIHSLIGGQTVLNVQLRTAPAFPDLMFGTLQLKVNFSPGDPCIPGNPIIPGNPVIPGNPIVPAPPDGMTYVAVCGRIMNPNGVAFGGGGIYSALLETDVPPTLVAPFLSQTPQPPPVCPEYDLTGYIQVTNDLASQFANTPGQFQVLFSGKVPDGPATMIGGSLGGGAWGTVGIPQPPPIIPAPPPIHSDDACNIALQPTPPPI
jgi:hypothetical protein